MQSTDKMELQSFNIILEVLPVFFFRYAPSFVSLPVRIIDTSVHFLSSYFRVSRLVRRIGDNNDNNSIVDIFRSLNGSVTSSVANIQLLTWLQICTFFFVVFCCCCCTVMPSDEIRRCIAWLMQYAHCIVFICLVCRHCTAMEQQKQHHDKMNYLQEQTHTLNSAASRIMRSYVLLFTVYRPLNQDPHPCVYVCNFLCNATCEHCEQRMDFMP